MKTKLNTFFNFSIAIPKKRKGIEDPRMHLEIIYAWHLKERYQIGNGKRPNARLFVLLKNSFLTFISD